MAAFIPTPTPTPVLLYSAEDLAAANTHYHELMRTGNDDEAFHFCECFIRNQNSDWSHLIETLVPDGEYLLDRSWFMRNQKLIDKVVFIIRHFNGYRATQRIRVTAPNFEEHIDAIIASLS